MIQIKGSPTSHSTGLLDSVPLKILCFGLHECFMLAAGQFQRSTASLV
jgi:hypothetical protein